MREKENEKERMRERVRRFPTYFGLEVKPEKLGNKFLVLKLDSNPQSCSLISSLSSQLFSPFSLSLLFSPSLSRLFLPPSLRKLSAYPGRKSSFVINYFHIFYFCINIFCNCDFIRHHGITSYPYPSNSISFDCVFFLEPSFHLSKNHIFDFDTFCHSFHFLETCKQIEFNHQE